MTDPEGVGWSVQLRSSGRVCVDVSRVRSAVYLIVALWLPGVVAVMLAAPGWTLPVLGVLLSPLALALPFRFARQLLRVGSWRSPHVVVDDDGVSVPHDHLQAPWTQLHGAIGYTANHNRWVALVTTREWYDAWLAGRPWPRRLLRPGWRRADHANVRLPANLTVDHELFAAWLTYEARARMVTDLERRRFEQGGSS